MKKPSKAEREKAMSYWVSHGVSEWDAGWNLSKIRIDMENYTSLTGKEIDTVLNRIERQVDKRAKIRRMV